MSMSLGPIKYAADYDSKQITSDRYYRYVKLDDGDTVRIPHRMIHQIIIQNLAEAPIDQMARKVVLMDPATARNVELERLGNRQFGNEAFLKAKDKIYDEIESFFPEKTRKASYAIAEYLISTAEKDKEMDRWYQQCTYTGADGKRYIKPEHVTVQHIIRQIRTDLTTLTTMGYSYIRRSLPQFLSILGTIFVLIRIRLNQPKT